MPIPDAWLWATLAVLGLGGSALCSGLETALYCVNPVKLRVRLTNAADRAAARVRRELDHPERTLATVLIGNNTCNYLGTVGLTGIIDDLALPPWAQVVVQVAVLSPMLLIFGEVLPKDLMRVGADRWAYRLVPLLVVGRWLATLTLALPVVQGAMFLVRRLLPGSVGLVPLSGRASFAALVRDTVNEGGVSLEQASLVDRALVFERLGVAEVMTPWAAVLSIEESASSMKARRTCAEGGFTRYPVLTASGRLAGVIDHIDMYLRPTAAVRDLLRQPARVSSATSIRDALTAIRQSGVPLAVVVGAGDVPVGLVTSRDLVSPLTGIVPQR